MIDIEKKHRYEVLDAFRGIFALSVVIYHMHVIDSVTELGFFKGSYRFVEFFFTLSGFVMAHCYVLKNMISLSDYIISRTFRLFPLHLVMLIIFILLECIKLYQYNHGLVFNNIPFSGNNAFSEIIPNLFLIHSWTFFTKSVSFNFPSWSISIEYYVYMIFLLSLLIKNRRSAIWIFLLIGSLVNLLMNINILTPEAERGLSCFFAGVITYKWVLKYQARIDFEKNTFSLLEALSLLLIIFVVSLEIVNSVILILVFCVSIIIFSQEKGFISDILKKKYFNYIGRISYSIYMTHAAVLFCLISLFIILGGVFHVNYAPMVNGIRYLTLGDRYVNNIIILIAVSVVIFVSSITHKYIERPGQSLGKWIMINKSDGGLLRGWKSFSFMRAAENK
jgi:peptidoglycan/LPS O-acetylase OafA/YrhL